MTVAFSDTNLLCDMLRPLPTFANKLATSRATSTFYVRRKPVSATINTLANALYKVGRWRYRSGGTMATVLQRCMAAVHGFASGGGGVLRRGREARKEGWRGYGQPRPALAYVPSSRRQACRLHCCLRRPQVFCASDSRAHEEMRQACFDYLALGGMYSSEGPPAWPCLPARLPC